MNDLEDTESHDGDIEEADYTSSSEKAELVSHSHLVQFPKKMLRNGNLSQQLTRVG